MILVGAWARAFAVTLAIEVPIAQALLRPNEPRLWRRLGLAFFANLSSHLAVWFVWPALVDSWPKMVACAETWAVVSEALFYTIALAPPAGWDRRGLARVLGVALLTNAASFLVGLVLRAVWDWP